jgi:hypothetical protein
MNELNGKVRAVQIVNQMTVQREGLGNSFTRKDHEAEREAFRKGCADLAQIDDADVKLVLAKLLSQGNTLNLGNCKAWTRLLG